MRWTVVAALCWMAAGRKRIHDPSRPLRPTARWEFATDPQELPSVYNASLAEAHLVKDLPGLPFGYSHPMYAGDLGVHEATLQNKGSIFYWLMMSQSKPEEAPLVVWLNGGPGCSSLEGLLVEHGPFLAVATGFDLELNPYSWNLLSNVVYVDQPVGTGFAAVDNETYAQSQEEVNVMFMAFLKRFMAVHPHFRSRPLYLAGESYAGRYIPHFATEILKAPASEGLNIQGVLIGNGWTHPMVQSESFPGYSFHQGIVSSQQRIMLDGMVRECRAKWDVDPYAHETWVVCERIQTLLPKLTGDNQIGEINQYDVRLYDTTAGGEWPWRTTGEADYLNRRDVREALHVRSGLSWSECSDGVSDALTHEDMYPTVDVLRDLLPRIPVLLYNGQFDWICNHVGVETFLDQMEFEGKEQFVDANKRGLWVSGSRLAGYVKSGGNLTFVTMLGGSHMVPMDKRPQALDLLHRFTQGNGIADVTTLSLVPSASNELNKASITSADTSVDAAATHLAAVPARNVAAASAVTPPALAAAGVSPWLAALIGVSVGALAPLAAGALRRSGSSHAGDGYASAPC